MRDFEITPNLARRIHSQIIIIGDKRFPAVGRFGRAIICHHQSFVSELTWIVIRESGARWESTAGQHPYRWRQT